MPPRRSPVVRVLVVLLVAGAGALCADFLRQWGMLPGPRVEKIYPLPHQIAKYPGGVALRFAMAHDVIHERFARHGKGYYRERNRLARLGIKQEQASGGGKRSERYFTLHDDLGAGLDYLGEHDAAVRVLRGKLKEQEAAGLKGRELYTTYANLGTFLIHGSFPKAQRGDAEAKQRMREGLAFIHKSIKVNPEAHFGREIWQAVTAEFFLAALDNPRLLLKYDLAGNRLDERIEPGVRGTAQVDWYSRKALGRAQATADFLADPKSPEERDRLRQDITRVGTPAGPAVLKGWQRGPVPFDEPVLGVIGMWRLGGGANPHFALLLGETMYRVGQRHIAWCAFERAARMADRFWPDAKIRQQFADHCRKRQRDLLERLPEDEVQTLPRRFEAELAYGQRYQAAYQQYEEEKIAAGVSLDDPHFYDAFHASHGKIASPPGEADSQVIEQTPPSWAAAAAILFAGIFAMIAALIIFRGLSNREATPAPPGNGP
jgi:hypothetical protein